MQTYMAIRQFFILPAAGQVLFCGFVLLVDTNDVWFVFLWKNTLRLYMRVRHLPVLKYHFGVKEGL